MPEKDAQNSMVAPSKVTPLPEHERHHAPPQQIEQEQVSFQQQTQRLQQQMQAVLQKQQQLFAEASPEMQQQILKLLRDSGQPGLANAVSQAVTQKPHQCNVADSAAHNQAATQQQQQFQASLSAQDHAAIEMAARAALFIDSGAPDVQVEQQAHEFISHPDRIAVEIVAQAALGIDNGTLAEGSARHDSCSQPGSPNSQPSPGWGPTWAPETPSTVSQLPSKGPSWADVSDAAAGSEEEEEGVAGSATWSFHCQSAGGDRAGGKWRGGRDARSAGRCAG